MANSWLQRPCHSFKESTPPHQGAPDLSQLHSMINPPLAQVTLAVTHLALGSHRNATMGAMSSTWPMRFAARVRSIIDRSTSEAPEVSVHLLCR